MPNTMTPTSLKSLGINISSAALALTSTTAKHKLGTVANGENGQVYVYAKFGGTITAKNFVKIKYADSTDRPWSFIETAAATDQAVAVALVSGVSNDYGWFQLSGLCTACNVTTGVAAGANIVPSSTAGRCSAYANTDVVQPIGIVLVTAASNTADVMLISGVR